MSRGTGLVMMLGGVADTPLEQLMRRALEASALDTLETALATGRLDCALLLADREPQLPLPPGIDLELDRGEEPFLFGRRLAEAAASHGIRRLLYLGAGSAPILGAEEIDALIDGLRPEGATCVTNNYFSSDFFSLSPARLLDHLDPPPPTDNLVPRRLREGCDVEVIELERSTATQLNLDSPVDLAALALSGRSGPRLGRLLDEWAPDTERLARAASRFPDREAEVLVAGRVSSRSWQYLERETACRVRILAEERGMTAAGRDAGGDARSLLGQLIDAIGPQAFFEDRLPQLCDAAFIDLRPAMVHLGIHASPGDRFAADLGLPAEIEHDRLREIVEAAGGSPVPVVLGAHTLVAGVLMLLNDWAWEEYDRAAGLA